MNQSPHLLTGVPPCNFDEFWIPDVGSADLVGVGADGTLAIVECKLKTNPEIRRDVVGQLLAYAAGLWQMSYDDSEATWRHRSQRGLRDHLTEKVGIGLDADDLRRTVSERLAYGVW